MKEMNLEKAIEMFMAAPHGTFPIRRGDCPYSEEEMWGGASAALEAFIEGQWWEIFPPSW